GHHLQRRARTLCAAAEIRRDVDRDLDQRVVARLGISHTHYELARGNAFCERLIENSRPDATIASMTGQRFGTTRSSMPACACSSRRSPTGSTDSGETVSSVAQYPASGTMGIVKGAGLKR